MTEREALLAAICDNPDEDTPRLIFADWLDENGEELDRARAEFIRLQITLSRSGQGNQRNNPRFQRAEKLREANADKWIERMCKWDSFKDYDNVASANRRGFVRGFLQTLVIPLENFARCTQLFRMEPIGNAIVELSGIGNGPELMAFVDCPAANIVVEISGQRPSSYLGSGGFSRLVGSKNLTQLRRLEILEDRVGVAGVEALVNSPILTTLQHLCLYDALASESIYRPVTKDLFRSTRCDPDTAIEILVGSPKVAGLKKLNVMYNGLSERSAQALLDSPYLTSLRALAFEEDSSVNEEWGPRLRERFPENYWTYKV